jgi:hypothetical protein
MTPDKHEIAVAGAEWHVQSFCSHMPDEDQQRVREVIYDLIISSLEAYEGLLEVQQPVRPVSFSCN